MQQLMTQVPTMHEDDKIFAFKQALDKPIAAKVAEQAPKSLQEAMYAAVQAELYVGRSSASANSNSFFGQRQGGGNRFASSSSSAPMEVSALDQMGELSLSMTQRQARRPRRKGTRPQRTSSCLPCSIAATAVALATEARRGDKVPGVSKADFDRCMKENRCLKCKQVGHLARECTNPPSLKW